MKKIASLSLLFVLSLVISTNFSCKKSQEPEVAPEKQSSPQWGANDDKYVASLKRFGAAMQGRMNTLCVSSAGDSTYGWYSDPDSVLIEGPYSIAKVGSYESIAETCTDVYTLAEDAEDYLTNEGFSDLAYGYANRPHLMINSANALLELKEQMIIEPMPGMNPARSGRQAGVANCLYQALGFTALAELGANWATMSRQQILKRVGKIISKHLGFWGAIIAITSFIDCMWG